MSEHRVIATCLAAAALFAFAWRTSRAEPAGQSSPGENPSETACPPATAVVPLGATADIVQPHAPDEIPLLRRIRRRLGSPLDGTLFGDSEPAGSATPLVPPFDEAYAEISDREARPASVGETAADLHYEQTLRDAARQLETAAADLEDRRAFEQADALWGWARRLRQEARSPTASALPRVPAACACQEEADPNRLSRP